MKLEGLIPAVFTPMKENGSLYLDKVEALVKHLLADGVAGLFVCGSTGESASLSTDERIATALAFVSAVKGKIPVAVQAGHDSLVEARKLAGHAQKIGAAAISAVPPSYFKIGSLNILVDCAAQVAEAAPDLPFYYYNIPSLTGAQFNMVDFVEVASKRIPNFAGIKHSTPTMHEITACSEYQNGKYSVLFGTDEMLLSGLVAGATGAVGSNYNYAAPLYLKIIDSLKKNDLQQARHWQSLSVKKVRILFKYRGLPAIKAMMKLIGVDCGPMRLPFESLTTAELRQMEREMRDIGFFEWGRE